MIKTIILSLVLVQSAFAIELLGYKSSGGDFVYAQPAVETIWSGASPACLKEGGKVLGVNKAFKSASLGYADCSSSTKRQRIHRAQGFKVTVIKLSELPEAMIKEIKSRK